MAKLEQAFDANKEEKLGSFEPVPYGWYTVQITKSDLKDTKKKDGKYINLCFDIIDGKYKGRKIFTNLNIINQNPIAVEVARKGLASICEACDKMQVEDTEELHGIPIQVLLKIKPASGDFPPGNEPVNYKALGEKVTAAPGKKSPGKAALVKTKKKKVEVDTESAGWDDDE